MSNNISNKQLNISSAGQIALNLDKKDGQDGIISKNIWEEFWKSNDSEGQYKGKKETDVGQNGISVRDAMKLIMTRIFNAANSFGKEINDIGNKWLNGIENHEQIDANTISELKEDAEVEASQNNNSLECAKQAFTLIKNKIQSIQLPPGMNAEQFAKDLKESYDEHINDKEGLPKETTVADMVQSILTTAFCKNKTLNDTEQTEMQKLALINAARLAPNDSIYGVACSEISKDVDAAFNKMRGGQTSGQADATITNNHGETPVENENPDLEEVDLASKVGYEKVEEYKRYCQELVENAKQILINSKNDFGLTQNEIDYINSIDYESIQYGSARWDKQAGRIHINYNDQNVIEAFNNTNPNVPLKPNVGYFVKLILHEVKHADLNTNQNTQNEERACEGRALRLAYQLYANANNNDKQKYNMLLPDSRETHGCIMLSDLGDGTKIDETKLQEYLNQWLIDCEYSQRLEVGPTVQ